MTELEDLQGALGRAIDARNHANAHLAGVRHALNIHLMDLASIHPGDVVEGRRNSGAGRFEPVLVASVAIERWLPEDEPPAIYGFPRRRDGEWGIRTVFFTEWREVEP